MTTKEKVKQLQHLIEKQLTPLIHDDYIYMDIPYHANLGDTLIWQGTLDFLHQLPQKCLYSSWFHGDKYIKILSKHNNCQILLHGGGNFGDIWTGCHQFRKKVIENSPGREIIILPQTIYYQKEQNLLQDADFFAHYPNVTICARDSHSFQTLQHYFPKNPSLLVPDMAFCMNQHWHKKETSKNNTLFVMRTDHELPKEEQLPIPPNADIRDWPTLNNIGGKILYEFLNRSKKSLLNVDQKMGTSFTTAFNDFYWQRILRHYNVSLAVNFVQSYKHLYTTRLHAAILGVILGKTDINIFDNLYGKMTWFYDTWLNDTEGVSLLNTHSIEINK